MPNISAGAMHWRAGGPMCRAAKRSNAIAQMNPPAKDARLAGDAHAPDLRLRTHPIRPLRSEVG